MPRIRKLAPAQFGKIWGSRELAPWFPASGQPVGEVWFEDTPGLPLLVKFLFTTERLSVQVHPNDAEARAAGQPRGKTEMWHILRAAPGASIGLGLTHAVSREKLRAAALSGEVERLLRWIPVRAGDTFLVPAHTIHALGPGLALCEIQQHSDITYRLYDYGRPRELHLEAALAVAAPEPYTEAPSRPAGPPGVWETLAGCAYFHTAHLALESPLDCPAHGHPFHLLVVLAGEGSLEGQPYRPGECWHIPPGAGYALEPAAPSRFLRTFPPG
jgi:mannose-6-phosphate isomerase